MEENGQTLVTFGSPKLYFPSDVFKWIKQNANPKMALKLMKVCKYFQHANGFPFFVVKSILLFDSTWTLNTLDNEEITAESMIPNKLWWIIGNITIYPSPTAVANLLVKTVVFDIQTLTLDGQNITMGEFKLLTDGGMIENFDSRQSAITDENGEIVPLEHIIECLPNARYIRLNKDFLIKGAAEAKVSSIHQNWNNLPL